MSKIPQLIVTTYLRRWPPQVRTSQFNFLAQYSWLKPILEEVRTEVLPTDETAITDGTTQAVEDNQAPLTENTLASELRNPRSKSVYTELIRLPSQGEQVRMKGVSQVSRQPVIIEYYQDHHGLLPLNNRQPFKDLVRLSQTDNHPEEDLRVIWPIDVFADTYESTGDNQTGQCHNSYYLVFKNPDEHNNVVTLAQQLATKTQPLAHRQIRQIIEQILQSLRHLHCYPIRLASEQVQLGLSHGNLTVDSVICVKRSGHTFFYLSNFAFWKAPLQAEQTPYSSRSATAKKELIKKDLRDLGKIGQCLLKHQQKHQQKTGQQKTGQQHSLEASPSADNALKAFIDRLGKDIEDTDAAWYEWINLAPLPAVTSTQRTQSVASAPSSRVASRWPWLAGSLLLALFAAGGWWWWRSRDTPPPLLTEQVSDVQSLEGSFTYATVASSRWRQIVEQPLFKGQQQVINQVVNTHHSGFIEQIIDIDDTEQGSIQAAINRVKHSATAPLESNEHVDFAIVPLVKGVTIPSTLGYEIIAYDGLAIVTPFSYEYRTNGAPKQWKGSISLQEIRKIYTPSKSIWDTLIFWAKPVSSYGHSAVSEIFRNEFVLEPNGLKSSKDMESGDDMIRKMLEQFEGERENFSKIIGFSSISAVIKQCSVYPLAVSAPGRAAVSPLIMTSGEPISPETDLCDDKTLYQPNFEAFRRDRYPLAYPLVVVYPQDNSRAAAGEKFADMMLTTEIQKLFLEAGLVPVVDPFELAEVELAEIEPAD